MKPMMTLEEVVMVFARDGGDESDVGDAGKKMRDRARTTL
jgi:hypothetical protein